MVKRDIIRKAEEGGLFCELVKCGVIGVSTLMSVQMYDRYATLIKLGAGKMDAYTQVSMEFNVSERYVMSRVKEMEG